jgi:hypothetical protein
MMRAIILFVVGCIGLTSPCCRPAVTPQPPAGKDCAAACERLEQLRCEAAKPTQQGASCVEWCTSVENSGFATMRPECVVKAMSCAEADRMSSEGCSP